MDNHPTIDIIKTPLLTCPNPVYNCIEYCFQANDYILQAAGFSGFLLQFPPDNYADGIVISVGGKAFISATPGAVGSFSWQGTLAQITQSFTDMLQADYYFGAAYTVLANPALGLVFAISNSAGLAPNWSMLFPVAIPPIFTDSPGLDLITRDSYRLVTEVWKLEATLEQSLVVTRGFEPDASTGQVCLDIAKILRGCVNTTFPGLVGGVPIVEDTNIKAQMYIRFGEVYSSGASSCEAEAQFFERTTPIAIINSAFQKDNTEGILPFCFSEVGVGQRFLTNSPNFADICVSSFAWLWLDYDLALADFIEANPALFTAQAEVDFLYSDSSTSSAVIGVTTGLGGQVLIIPAGLAQLSGLTDPGKTVSSYDITFGVLIDGLPNLVPLSETKTYTIADSTFCCCSEEFYFLSEPGGYDTILFNCLRETDLEYSSTEFCGYESCEGDILAGGKEEAETRAFEVFRTTTRFLDKYDSLNWFREFLKSPKRLWRKEGRVYKIRLLNDRIELRRREGFIYVELEYVLSFELNTQRN